MADSLQAFPSVNARRQLAHVNGGGGRSRAHERPPMECGHTSSCRRGPRKLDFACGAVGPGLRGDRSHSFVRPASGRCGRKRWSQLAPTGSARGACDHTRVEADELRRKMWSHLLSARSSQRDVAETWLRNPSARPPLAPVKASHTLPTPAEPRNFRTTLSLGKPPALSTTSWWWTQSAGSGLLRPSSLLSGRKTGKAAEKSRVSRLALVDLSRKFKSLGRHRRYS